MRRICLILTIVLGCSTFAEAGPLRRVASRGKSVVGGVVRGGSCSGGACR